MEKQKKITANFIIEILGRPADHVEKTLGELVEKLGGEKGVRIIESNVHPAKELEDKNTEDKKEIKVEQRLFTSFADVEAEFEGIYELVSVIFNYMPSNVEILSPESLVISNNFLSEFLTGIILKLHKYDEVTKKVVHDNAILEARIKNLVEFIEKNVKKKSDD